MEVLSRGCDGLLVHCGGLLVHWYTGGRAVKRLYGTLDARVTLASGHTRGRYCRCVLVDIHKLMRPTPD
jgi:hypothetical protein